MQAAAAREFGQPLMIENRPLAAVNDSIQEFLHGKTKACIVITP